MKTYLLDTLNRYKRFSENLDVRTVLCNKSWWVFNDCGEKEVYIFEGDGSLIISLSGKVTNATWKYIAANKSLIISGNEQSYMLHPAFMDGVIFVLQLDGTNECSFMIDEGNTVSFKPKSLTDLNLYFEKKEQLLIEAERQAKREQELLRQQQIDNNNYRQIEGSQVPEANNTNNGCLPTVIVIVVMYGIWLFLLSYGKDARGFYSTFLGLIYPWVIIPLAGWATYKMFSRKK